MHTSIQVRSSGRSTRVFGSLFGTVCGFLSCATSLSAFGTILPPNDLYKEDTREAANISKEEFNTIIDNIVDVYQPFAKLNGGTIKSNNKWEDSTVNASAQRAGNTWTINMYGGLARRAEVTADGFALVVCHELGHHMGGFPFVGGIQGLLGPWAANEGSSDYFATHACARRIWKEKKSTNSRYRNTVESLAKEKCDQAWSSIEDQNLCYRVSDASKSLAVLLAALKKSTLPDFATPDTKTVGSTSSSHPAAQCRLDTMFAGAICGVSFDDAIIPGGKAGLFGRNGQAAEAEAYKFSCSAKNEISEAARPRCWFKPRENISFLDL